MYASAYTVILVLASVPALVFVLVFEIGFVFAFIVVFCICICIYVYICFCTFHIRIAMLAAGRLDFFGNIYPDRLASNFAVWSTDDDEVTYKQIVTVVKC